MDKPVDGVPLEASSGMRWLFITNICPHYRVGTYELMSSRNDVTFLFCSLGDEWYWDPLHGVREGRFPHEYLRSSSGSRPGFARGLAKRLWEFDGDVIVKCITGRLALPMSLLAAKVRRKPFVLWTGLWQHPRTIFHLVTFPVTWLVYQWADAIVVYGEHVRRYLVSRHVRAEKIFVAPHAVDNEVYRRRVEDSERQALRDTLGITQPRVVLFVGRLEAVKGVDTLVDAFAEAELSDCQLLIVGHGSLADELQEQARQLNLGDRVRFAGYMGPEDTVALYALADLLVLPSVPVKGGKELWGLVVNEAMNQGTPVVATTAVGAAAGGLVRHGENGEIVAAGSRLELRDSLHRIMGSEGYRSRLSRGARESISTWGNEAMVRGFEAAVRHARRRREPSPELVDGGAGHGA